MKSPPKRTPAGSVAIAGKSSTGGAVAGTIAAFSVVVFVVFLMKYPQYRKLLLLNGIRNLLLVPSPFVLVKNHMVGGWTFDEQGELVSSYFHFDFQHLERLLAYVIAVILVFRALIVKARKDERA